MTVTAVADVAATLEAHRRAFAAHGLEDAFARVIALVTQPGVEFGDQSVHPYQPAAAALSRSILDFPGLVFEAHSTDYQTEATLGALVRDHFAILKVGPAVTYAWREALFALSLIEEETLPPDQPHAAVREVIERCMLEHWRDYYAGDAQALRRRCAWSGATATATASATTGRPRP